MQSNSPCRERVPLRAISEQPCFSTIREPSGEEELSVVGIDTRAATALLCRLVDDRTDVGELPASDRDALLAALHRVLWGDRIVAPIECATCEAAYDVSVELSQLQVMIEQQRETALVVSPRTLEDDSRRRYRLPTAEEECAAADLGPVEGRKSLASKICETDEPDLDLRLEKLAPLIDVDLQAPCAECRASALVRFDIQSFVLQRLLDERQLLLAEIDAIATGFNWTLSEILGLPRSVRRAFAERLARAKAFA